MRYRKYRDVYAQSLLNPTDTELKLDLQQHEDQLDILNIIIAREHAKAQVNLNSLTIYYLIAIQYTSLTKHNVHLKSFKPL